MSLSNKSIATKWTHVLGKLKFVYVPPKALRVNILLVLNIHEEKIENDLLTNI